MTDLREHVFVGGRGLGNQAFRVRTNTTVDLAINAGGAATFKTTLATHYTLNGIQRFKAALSAQAFSTGHAVVADGFTCFFVVCLAADGSVSTLQGTPFTTLAINGVTHYVNNITSPTVAKTYNSVFLPNVDMATLCPIGIIKVACSGATFTAGTTALDASGVTATYYDLNHLPTDAVL